MAELLPWQHNAWRELAQRRHAARFPHALLFSGIVGLGKRLFAEQLIRSLLCKAAGEDGLPCGICRSCTLLAAGNHPDYLCVTPEDFGKSIKVDQIRELSAFLNHTSQFAGLKAALIDPADRMNSNAANSLLKTLEEPPGDSLLLLVSAHPASLPATVRSRCGEIKFKRPSNEEAVAWLSPQLRDADPNLLLSLCHGAPLRAQTYAASDNLVRRQSLFKCYCDALAGQIDPVQAAKNWADGNIQEHLVWLIDWYTDMIRLKMASASPRILNPDFQSELQRLAAPLSERVLFHQLDSVLRMRELRTTQVNLEILLEAFFGECAQGYNRSPHWPSH